VLADCDLANKVFEGPSLGPFGRKEARELRGRIYSSSLVAAEGVKARARVESGSVLGELEERAVRHRRE